MKRAKRLLVAILCITMLFTMTPTTAFAAGVTADNHTVATEVEQDAADVNESATVESEEPAGEQTLQPEVKEKKTSSVQADLAGDVGVAPEDANKYVAILGFRDGKASIGSDANVLFMSLANNTNEDKWCSFELTGELAQYITIDSKYNGVYSILGDAEHRSYEIKVEQASDKKSWKISVKMPANSQIGTSINCGVKAHAPITTAVAKIENLTGAVVASNRDEVEVSNTLTATANGMKITATNNTPTDANPAWVVGGDTNITVSTNLSAGSTYTDATPKLKSLTIRQEITFCGFVPSNVPSGWTKVTDSTGKYVGLYRDVTYSGTSMTADRADGTFNMASATVALNNCALDATAKDRENIKYSTKITSAVLENGQNVTLVQGSDKWNIASRYADFESASQSLAPEGSSVASLGTEKPGVSNVNVSTVKVKFDSQPDSAYTDSGATNKTYLAINGEYNRSADNTKPSYKDLFTNKMLSFVVKDEKGNVVEIDTTVLTNLEKYYVKDFGYCIPITDKNGKNLPLGIYTLEFQYENKADINQLGNDPIFYANKFFITDTASPTTSTGSRNSKSRTLSGQYVPLNTDDSHLTIEKTGTKADGSNEITYKLKVKNSSETSDEYAKITDHWPSAVNATKITGVKGAQVSFKLKDGTTTSAYFQSSNEITFPYTPVTGTTIKGDNIADIYINYIRVPKKNGEAVVTITGTTNKVDEFTIGNTAGLGNGTPDGVVQIIVNDYLTKTAWDADPTDTTANAKQIDTSNPAVAGESVFFKVELENKDQDRNGKYLDHYFTLKEEPASELTLKSAKFINEGETKTIDVTNTEEVDRTTEAGKDIFLTKQLIKGNTVGTWVLEYTLKKDLDKSKVENKVRGYLHLSDEVYPIPQATCEIPVIGDQRANVAITKDLGTYAVAKEYVYTLSDGFERIDAIDCAPRKMSTNSAGDSIVNEGDAIIYCVKISNKSSAKTPLPADVPVREITDKIPDGLRYMGVTTSGTINFNGSTGKDVRVACHTEGCTYESSQGCTDKMYYFKKEGTYGDKKFTSWSEAEKKTSSSNNNGKVTSYLTTKVNGQNVTWNFKTAEGEPIVMKANDEMYFYFACQVEDVQKFKTATNPEGRAINTATLHVDEWGIESNFDDEGNQIGSQDTVSDDAPAVIAGPEFQPGLAKWISRTKSSSYDGGTSSSVYPETNTSMVVKKIQAVRYSVQVTNNIGSFPSMTVTDYIPEGYKLVEGSTTDSKPLYYYKDGTTDKTVAISKYTYTKNSDGPDVITFNLSRTENSNVYALLAEKSSAIFRYWVEPNEPESGTIKDGGADGFLNINKVYCTYDRDFSSATQYKEIWNNTDDEICKTENTLEAEAVTYVMDGYGCVLKKGQTAVHQTDEPKEVTTWEETPLMLHEGQEFKYHLKASPCFDNNWKLTELKFEDTLPYIGDDNGSQFDVEFKDKNATNDITVTVNGTDLTRAELDTYIKEVKKTVDGKKQTLTVSFEDQFVTDKLVNQNTKRIEGDMIVTFPVKAKTGANVVCVNKYTLSYVAKDGSLRVPVTLESNVVKDQLPVVTKAVEIKKAIKGTDATLASLANKFSFNLKDASGKTIGTAKNDAEGKVKFNAIEYRLPGEYTYTVEEVTTDTSKWTPDGPVQATVNVKPDSNGNLKAELTYGKDNNGNVKSTITNTYIPDPVDWTPVAEKTLVGKKIAANQFEFALKDASGKTVDSAKNDQNGKVQFSKLSFDKAGTYTYTVNEVAGDDDNYTYDSTVYTVTITVTDDNGKLVATPSYKKGNANVDKLAFENSYTPDATAWTPEASKTLTGAELENAKFTFQLSGVTGTNTEGVSQTVKNTADGKVPFTAISYTAAGEYKYTITETAGDDNYVYDSTKYDVTVTVVDNNGKLSASATYKKGDTTVDSASFVNKPSPTTVNIEAEKTLVGKTIAADQFSFDLMSGGKTLQTKSNDKDGKVTFDAITLSKVGTYNYTVSEAAGDDHNYTYDDTVYDVTVVVTNDNGQLKATKTYKKGNADVDKLAFENSYTPDSTSWTPQAFKTLTGADLEDAAFTFELKGASANTEGVSQTATNNAKGTVSFNAISYTEAGVYKYTIKETAKTGDYVYDEATYNVTVTVVDNNGTLVATPSYKKGEEPVPSVSFTNKVKPTTVSLEAEKTLVGKTIAADQFSFDLKSGDKTLQTKSNDANGKIAFDTINYDKAGTYKYTVSEVAGDDHNYTYDDTVYDVTVVVTNDNGQLKATKTYKKGNADVDKLAFENSYTPDSTSWTPKATKTLTGADLENAVFTFQLKGVSANTAGVSKTATNTTAASDNVKFEALTYTEAGEYKYTITETAGKGNYVYDSTTYGVTVTVVDNNGTLVATPAYEKNGEAAQSVIFKNKTKPVEVKFDAEKTLKGKTIAAGQFSFDLKSGGDVLQNKSNDAEGKIKFDAIKLEQTGTYTYTVSEVYGDDDTITYDDTVYDITVNVTNNNGQLEAAISYKKGDANVDKLAFENSYTPKKTSWTPVAHKTFTAIEKQGTKEVRTPIELVGGEFKFELYEDGKLKETQLNGEDGDITFSTIDYTSVQKHVYTIKEIPEAQFVDTYKLVEYDESVYTATVNVTDDGGQLVPHVTYQKDGQAYAEDLVEFANDYPSKPRDPWGELELRAHKDLVGTKTLEANQFEFEVYRTDEAYKRLEGENALSIKGKNDANGDVTFDKNLVYTKASEVGDYYYVMHEVKGDDTSIFYDKNTYKFHVEVTQHGDSKLDAKIVEGAPTGDIALTYDFTNYEVVPTEVSLETKKNVVDLRVPKAGEFTFELLEVLTDGTTVTKNQLETRTNGYDLTGKALDDVTKVLFSAIEYKKTTDVGTHTYIINEVAGNNRLVAYDGGYVEVTVEVTADDKGNLTASEPVYTKYDANKNKLSDGNVFNNEINPDPINVGLKATKELWYIPEVAETDDPEAPDMTKQLKLKGGEFNFVVLEPGPVPMAVDGDEPKPELNGKVVLKGTNDADGNVEFVPPEGEDGLKYTKNEIGTHTYQVAEVTGDDSHVTYSDVIYTINVTVSYNSDTDELEATVTDKDGNVIEGSTVTTEGGKTITLTGDNMSKLTFINKYTPDPIGALIEAEKKLTGKDLKAGEFKFQLLDANTREIVGEGYNDADGKIKFQFADNYFTKVGTYNYILVEVEGDEEHMTYDDKEYRVAVEVTIDDEGKLSAETKYLDGKAVFVNKYEPPTPKTGDNMPLIPLLGMMIASLLGVGGVAFTRRRKDA